MKHADRIYGWTLTYHKMGLLSDSKCKKYRNQNRHTCNGRLLVKIPELFT